MALQVIGAGLGRTGTMSLKLALERLLGGPCYHMVEVHKHVEEHVPVWHAAARGEAVDWDRLFQGYAAAVDEPASLHWEALMTHYPQALVVLTWRDPESWWRSANGTILEVQRHPAPPGREAWHAMLMEGYAKLYPQGVDEPEETQRRYLAHVERVKAGVPAERLLVWDATQGWQPLCAALGLPVPDEDFPHVNTTEEYRAKRAQRYGGASGS